MISPRQDQFAYATNSAAATRYYPADGEGWDISGFACVTFQGALAGGVTWTIESTLSKRNDTAPAVWDDISVMFTDLNTGDLDVASWADVAILTLQLNGINAERIRIKEVTSDATNTVSGWFRFV